MPEAADDKRDGQPGTIVIGDVVKLRALLDVSNDADADAAEAQG